MRACACVAVSRVKSHSLQLDVIVAPHRAVLPSPVAHRKWSNDIVKEGGGGDVGVCWKTLKIAQDKMLSWSPFKYQTCVPLQPHMNEKSFIPALCS